MPDPKNKPGVRGIELLVLATVKSRTDDGSGYKLRVVQWVHAKGFSVRLERRAFYTKDGTVMPGKAEGLTLEDLALLHPHWKAMIQLMKHPPAPPPLPAAPKPKPEDDIEEVPFQ